MFIQGFKEPLSSQSNFVSAVQLCKLCYYDPFTVAHEVNGLILHRYLNLKDLFIYFFLSNYTVYIVFSRYLTIDSLNKLDNVSTYESLLTKVKSATEHLHDYNIYCIGHSLGGAYANYISTQLNYKCITIGELEGITTRTNNNKIHFSKEDDMLCIKSNNSVKLNNDKATSILEGITNNSIDSYLTLINSSQGLEVKEKTELTVTV